MGAQKLMDGVFGILEVGELPRPGWTGLATRGGQPFGDAMVAEGTFLRSLRFGIQKAAAIRARLNAVPAADAIFFVDKHNTIRRDERGTDRAHLGAGRIGAVIAHFRNEEILAAGFEARRKAILAAIRRVHHRADQVVIRDVVALDPGTEITVRNIVFRGACTYAI